MKSEAAVKSEPFSLPRTQKKAQQPFFDVMVEANKIRAETARETAEIKANAKKDLWREKMAYAQQMQEGRLEIERLRYEERKAELQLQREAQRQQHEQQTLLLQLQLKRYEAEERRRSLPALKNAADDSDTCIEVAAFQKVVEKTDV